MSSASFPSLELHCRPSAWLRAAVLVLAVLAAVSLMLSALPAAWLALVPVLGLLAWRGVDAHAGLVLRFGGDGSLRAVDRCGSGFVGELRDVAERGPLLVLAVRLVPGEGSFAANGRSYVEAVAPQRAGWFAANGRSWVEGLAPQLMRRSGRWPRTAASGGAGEPRALALRICVGPDTATTSERRTLRLWCARHARADDGAPAALGLR